MIGLAIATLSVVAACAPGPAPSQSRAAPCVTSTPAASSVARPAPPSSIAASTATPTAAACVPTVPNGSTPPGEEAAGMNHGSGGLWTVLWPGGVVLIPPENVDADGVLWMKFPWWRGEGIVGRLRVTGSEAATGASLLADIPDYGETGFQASGLGFAGEGCWDIVATAGGARLELVTRVRLIRP